MNQLLKTTLAVLLFSLLSSISSAATINSLNDQNFSQNQTPDALSEITVDGAFKGKIKITIPDELAMIFDAKRIISELVVYGSAVTNNKILEKPLIIFENNDKTLVITVAADFAANENVVIKNAYVKGFNEAAVSSRHLILTLNDGTEKYLDNATKYITSSSTQDTQSPEPPTNIKVKDLGETVEITWIDPADLDLSTIEVLRGKNNIPVDGRAYKSVGANSQKFIDTDVQKGETVKYMLRASDGRNVSTVSQEISFVVGSTPKEEPVVVTEEVINEEPIIEKETPVEEIPAEEIQDCGGFTDIKPSDDLCVAADYVQQKGLFNGYSDGTFRLDQKINRAEFLKVIFTAFPQEVSNSGSSPFKDVANDVWYSSYVKTANTLGIISGYPDGSFKPVQTVSKIEAYKILLITAKADLNTEVSIPYSDTPIQESTKWYLPYVFYAKNYDLNIGGTAEIFDPAKAMTRGQIAELIYKFQKL
ncbi:MAG: S-layer homology domain-containing protein [Patescibacteria group bacterium]